MILLDTCALVWTVNGDRMSADALKAIRRAEHAGALYLSPVSAWEIGILAQRGKVSLGVSAEIYVSRVFSRPGVRIAALTPEIAVRASFLAGHFHADPADRMLVATAILMGLKLVTRDKEILRYASDGHLPVLAC